MRNIITKSGEILSLLAWQQRQGFEKGYDLSKLSKYFSTKEKTFDKKSWLLHELLFKILDRLREKAGEPVYANSAYRTQAEQMKLRKTNKGAVLNSPHPWGLGADINTNSNQQTDLYVKYLKEIAIEMDLQIRLGYNQYKQDGQTFVHLDVAPEMFGAGKPWEMFPNVPDLFRKPCEW